MLGYICLTLAHIHLNPLNNYNLIRSGQKEQITECFAIICMTQPPDRFWHLFLRVVFPTTYMHDAQVQKAHGHPRALHPAASQPTTVHNINCWMMLPQLQTQWECYIPASRADTHGISMCVIYSRFWSRLHCLTCSPASALRSYSGRAGQFC